MVPFGFSVGDFIDGIVFAKKFVRSLQARGGAVKQYQLLLDQLDRDCKVLLYFQSLDLPQDFATLERDVVQQANLLHEAAQDFLASVKVFQAEFERLGADKFYHAIGSKTKWFLSMEKKAEEYREKISIEQGYLSQLMSRLVM